MSDTAIRCEGLSKQYRIGKRERYKTLRDTLIDTLAAPFRWLRHPQSAGRNGQSETIWALKDVSFEIKHGEVVGIIGRNGAGKSTLLKILSRITDPTSGHVDIHGRIGSLLEVGTGFHPELTGRENIYLNGAILGMKKEEIKRRFDEIVAFAETEKFLDTPVKYYSSGMHMRLAFAVAAHLEPEILIVDEVLAVGDAQFQKKCLGKMGDVAKQGRTVLFVSHNLAALKGLCTSAFLLRVGRMALNSKVDDVVHQYLSEIASITAKNGELVRRHHGTAIKINGIQLLVGAEASNSIQAGSPCSIRIHYQALLQAAIGAELSVSIMLFTEGQKLVNLWTDYRPGKKIKILPEGVIDCSIPKWPFRSHSIRVDVFTHIGQEVQEWVEEGLFFDSYDGDYYQSGTITNPDQGMMFLDHEWTSYANE